MDTQWRICDLAFGPDPNPRAMVDQEWLLTNGTGAYAMGSVAGCNTRRYHGLLVAASRPPVGRVVALNQVLEQLIFQNGEGQETWHGTTCSFRGPDDRPVFEPQSYSNLRRFEKGLSVRWTYTICDPQHPRVPSIEFVRELSLHWREQAATLSYRVHWPDSADGSVRPGVLRLSPMLTLRDFHSLQHARESTLPSVTASQDSVVRVQRSDVTVTLGCSGARFIGAGSDENLWWYGVYYAQETQRGQDDQEDYFVPGCFEVELSSGLEVTLTVALGPQPADTVGYSENSRQAHLQRRLESVKQIQNEDGHDLLHRALVMAADDFVVDRCFRAATLKTVIAGYPWFSDWGRDTFIALPGLLLATGQLDEARSTLRVFAEAIQDGLVPNRFDDYDKTIAHYNSVDASLWFIHAALEYVACSGDTQAWTQWLADATIRVIEAFLHGTNDQIRMAGDGLISAGSASTQLTWMDAACDGVVFTPRHGKTVEVNALWYSALVGVGEQVATTRKSISDHYGKLAKRIKRSFSKVFWDEQLGYLRDHVWVDQDGQEQIDSSLRPNQIIAVSLPRSPLPKTKQRLVIKAVRQHLLTPFGLRTLPSNDPHYHGRYAGSAFDRDKAYHQGTVWPWLIGPYAEALMRVGKFSPASRAQARAVVKPLLTELVSRGFGQVHEIYEGDPPHRPVGCIAQAWSVAELLRVLWLIAK